MEVDQVNQQLIADAAHKAGWMPANVLRKSTGKDDDVAGRRGIITLWWKEIEVMTGLI